jgi:polyisoprenoid-binding protein YceI
MDMVKDYFKISMSLVLFMLFSIITVFSQDFNLNNEESELIVSGTSSLHDWHITAEKQKGTLALDQSNQLKIQKIKIDITAESLESGKNSMNKNTYKALKTDDFQYITFQLLEIKDISKIGNSDYNVKSVGNLTVSGVTKKINLDFKMNVSDTKVVLKGEKTIKMTEFNIDPPKALFGTITTGDEITIKFNTIFK